MTFRPTIWLDNVRVVPTIGISWKPSYETESNVLDQMRSLIYRWEDEGLVRGVTVDGEKASVAVQRTDGLLVTLSTQHLAYQFIYENSIENQGDLTAPVVKELRPLAPYAELMGEVKALLHETLPELMQSKGGVRRRPHRVGVVADGTMKGDMLPPGFESYLCHLGERLLWQVISDRPGIYAERVREQHERTKVQGIAAAEIVAYSALSRP